MFACERPRNKGLCGFVRILIWFLLRPLWYAPNGKPVRSVARCIAPSHPQGHSGFVQHRFHNIPWGICNRAALKGTNLRGQTAICGFLRVPAVFCGFLRKSAVFFENLRFPNALFSRKRRESAKICENLRKSAFGLGLSP